MIKWENSKIRNYGATWCLNRSVIQQYNTVGISGLFLYIKLIWLSIPSKLTFKDYEIESGLMGAEDLLIKCKH